MFCLRSWIPILFFLYDASPVYLILFLSATYVLNRPCVYCSLLLLLVVIAVFDFRGDWFEPRGTFLQTDGTTNQTTPSIPIVAEGMTLVASAFNETASALLNAAKDELDRRTRSRSAWYGLGIDWVKNVIARRELRIDCMNTVIRL